MAYIGVGPENKGLGLFTQDTFTGDGSTTTFDLTDVAPDGGGNEIQVFVDNVRQQEGSSNAYTLGFDGSSEFKRITFTAAPAASASIFVLNPGTKNVQQVSGITDNTITTAKLQNSVVTSAKINADAIDATKIADDSISEEHLDNTAVTGFAELSATAASDDVLLVFDTSAGSLKKIQTSNINSAPTITSISPTNATTGDGTGNHTFTITGTNFNASVSAFLLNNSGTEVAFDTVTRNSATQITAVIAKSSLLNSGEPFDIVVLNPNGQQAKLRNQINVDAQPVFSTAAGTLGTVNGGSAITTIDIVATDPDSAGAISFEFQSGSLPGGLSSTTVTEDGVSKFRITGTPTNPTANTTTNFTLRAVDAASNTSSRAYSITVNRTFTTTSFTSSGTFAVPSGTTNLAQVLVVAGGGAGGNDLAGGGGAGGLIFMPCVPAVASGTIAVTVGCGSANSNTGQGNDGSDSVFGASPSPGTTITLTAKGGGGGSGGPSPTANRAGRGGGSGGGGGGHGNYPSSGTGQATGGQATQPTQPGNSGAYGFGHDGGSGYWPGNPNVYIGGSGGGAGAAGGAGNGPQSGGAGKAYTIADGTSPVFYAGGGGGMIYNGGAGSSSNGGQGGGGGEAQDAQANKGGGGGGGHSSGTGGQGGKGIVIVRF